MNATLDMFGGPGAAPLPDRTPDRRQLTRIAAGVAVSIALHALLLSIYRQPAPGAPAAQPERLTVRLRPAAPPAPPAPQAEIRTPAREAAPVPPKPAPRKKAAERPARPVIAVDPEKRQSSEETYSVEPAPQPSVDKDAPATTAPRFDMDAALKTARKHANDPDPAKIGTALERLPPKPLQTENKFERAIKAAKRPDCKDGVPGGLLAPLFLAMDKKDSGCKW